MKKRRVLWIEDDSRGDLGDMFAPVFASARYDVVFALDVAEGIARLTGSPFEAIVLDIRLPPGSSPEWIALYNERGANRDSARLGLELADSLRLPHGASITIEPIPEWVRQCPIGFLSVELKHEVQDRINRLGIAHYQEKVVGRPTALLDLIEALLGTPMGHA